MNESIMSPNSEEGGQYNNKITQNYDNKLIEKVKEI